MRFLLPLLAALTLTYAAPAGAALPKLEHVYVIVLENKDYDDTFGPDTEAPYLAHELTRMGQLLPNYFGTSHASLGNYITMFSGQAPNMLTQADCPWFVDVFPGTPLPDGQVLGTGCAYPAAVKTLADQLQEKGLRWKGYMEDMGNTPGEPRTCRHPAIGAQDATQSARPNDQYATRHNPFVYFHSIIDSPLCDQNVVPLEELQRDIAQPETTPNFAFITPDLCHDGHDATCADGGLGGLPAVDQFLQAWVPRIVASPGFAESGLLVITWDEANIDPDSSTSCCGQPTGPNTPMPGIVGPGGGRTGTVLISPYVEPGSVSQQSYNHYGLLRSLEDLFGLAHLGYAALPSNRSFGDDVFTRAPTPPPAPRPACVPARSGRAVAALRLRDRVLTFRARRSLRVRIDVRVNGRTRAFGRPRRLTACRAYSLQVPKGTTFVRIRAGRAGQGVKRTAAPVS